jgi:hypothetical protein
MRSQQVFIAVEIHRILKLMFENLDRLLIYAGTTKRSNELPRSNALHRVCGRGCFATLPGSLGIQVGSDRQRLRGHRAA